MLDLSLAQARRLALGAQGFDRARPPGRVDARHLRRVLGNVGVLQIDSVTAVVRSHYVPAFSRLGPYDRGRLDRMCRPTVELFESWAHVAALAPVGLYPAFRWRMERRARGEEATRLARMAGERSEYIDEILREVAEHGPLSAQDLTDGGRRQGPWWGWSKGKIALEYLFGSGRLAATRRANFERQYDIPDRVIPADVLAAPALDEAAGQRALLTCAAECTGIATEADLADYFRMKRTEARPRIAELVEDGVLVPARVEGWTDAAFVHAGSSRPRRIDRAALLSPFDSLVWFRPRVERLFGFDYRLEFYVPEPKRRYGYYVMPFLCGDRFVARVDVRADRKAGVLRVPGAFAEPGADPDAVVERLRPEIAALAEWLGLDDVRFGRRGDLIGALSA